MSKLSPKTKANDGIRFSPVEKNPQEVQNCFTGMSITLPLPTLLVCYLIEQSIKNVKIYADDVLEAFTPKSPLPNKPRCTREDFMSVLHVLPAPNTEQTNIKFRQFGNTYEAPFVVYADFELILEPIQRQNRNTLYD